MEGREEGKRKKYNNWKKGWYHGPFKDKRILREWIKERINKEKSFYKMIDGPFWAEQV